jgi:hypothetical protein
VQIPAVQQKFHLRFAHITRQHAAQELAEETKMFGRARAERHVRQREQLAGQETSFWDVFTPPTVARRVGPAWVLVRYGNSLAQRIAFLQGLRVTKIKLPYSHG